MRTGDLARNTATGVKFTEVRSTITGSKKKTEVAINTFHFFRQTMKEQRALLGREEATTGTMVIQCRKSDTTTIMTHYRYAGTLYRIEQKLPDPLHNTYDITATKVNE